MPDPDRQSTPLNPLRARHFAHKTWVFRVAFVVLAAVLLLIGYMADNLNNERHQAQVRTDVQRQLTEVSNALSGKLHADLQLVRGLVSVIHLAPDLDQAQYAIAMRPLFEGRTHLRNVASAPDLVIRLMYPMAGNERAVGLDYRTVPGQLASVERARDTREVVMAGPLKLVQGGTGLIARVPVYLPTANGGERFWGIVSAVIDSDKLFHSSSLDDPTGPIEFALRGVDGSGANGAVFFGRPGLFAAQPERVEIPLLTGSWELAAVPRSGWPTQADDAWRVRLGMVLVAMVILGALALQARAVAVADAAQMHAEAASAQLTTLIEEAPDAMVIVASDGRIEMVNRQAETLFGWPRDELVGQSPSVLLPSPLRSDYLKTQTRYFESIQRSGPASIQHPIEFMGLHHDGSLMDVEICLNPLPSEHGVLATGVIRDIRARKQAEARAKVSERRVSVIADHLPVLISHFDRNVRYLFANAYFAKVFEVDHHALIGRSLREFRGEAIYAQMEAHVHAVLAGQARNFDSHAVIRGQLHFFQQSYVPDVDADGAVQGFFSVSVDTSELKRSEMGLVSSKKRLRMITDNIPALIAHIDVDHRFTFANAAWIDFYQVRPQDMVGRHVRDALGDAFYEKRRGYIEEVLATGQRVQFETVASVHGQERQLSVSLMPDLNESDQVVGLYSLGLDVTAQKEVEARLAEQARVDHLTGLPNRRGFEDGVAQAVARARRTGSTVGVMYLDVDYFKQINDTHGHAAGDAVLQTLAGRLKASVRGTDMVARLGGDEFVVLLESLKSGQEAAVVAEKILSAAREPIAIADATVSASVSIGIGLFTGTDTQRSLSDVLTQADEALYAAKRAGRDRYAVFTQAP